jgi:hypothetical protein
VQGFWETGRPPNFLVIVGVDDGSFRGAFHPVVRSFMIADDGSFVGE